MFSLWKAASSPRTQCGDYDSVLRACAYVRVGIYGGMGGGMRSRSHLYFSCFSLVICLYSSENGIGDPDPDPTLILVVIPGKTYYF